MKVRILKFGSYRTLVWLFPFLFWVGFGLLFFSILFCPDNSVVRIISLAPIILLFILAWFDRFLLPRSTLIISPDGIQLSEDGQILAPETINSIDLHIRGYKGEQSFSSRYGFKSAGFDNTITIKFKNQRLKTRFFLNDPNEERELVTLLKRNFNTTSSRSV